MTPSPRNRFPGARPFTEEDRAVYHGRTADARRVYELLMAKPLLTLYAESGFGKTSLVNAGLIPLLEGGGADARYLPVKVRFGLAMEEDKGQNTGILFQKITGELKDNKNVLASSGLPFIGRPEQTSLWYEMKLGERAGIKTALIFDQFEEVFSYAPAQIQFFKEQLLSLFSGIPKELNAICDNEIKKIETQEHTTEELSRMDKDLAFLYAPLHTRLLFAIREDRFGYINLFADYFPDILKDSYKLFPLTRAAAKDAISLPARAEGSFATPPFTFTPPALEKVLDKLAEANNIFDPFSIQLTCRYIENALVQKKGKTEIGEADVPDVGVIVKDFVEDAWLYLPKKDVPAVKLSIEKTLIAHDIERRITVHEGEWIRPNVADSLILAGLLKRERRGGIDYIELSHDRLIKPLLDDYRLRQQERELLKKGKARRIAAAVVIGLLIVAVAIISVNKLSLESKNEIILAEKKAADSSVATQKITIATYEKLADGDTVAAIRSAKQAISLTADSGSSKSLDTTLKKLLLAKYNLLLYKVDIFYADKDFENENNNGGPFQNDYAAALADKLQTALEKEKNLVVRKRLVNPLQGDGRWYSVYKNEIRVDADANEQTEGDRINDLLHRSSGLSFYLAKKSRTSSPGYISIILKNSNQ